MDAAFYEFFLSYKKRDTQDFVKRVQSNLAGRGYQVWLDSVAILPGQSIVENIEKGMRNSLVFVLVLSKNYFEGWAEKERRNILSFVEANSERVVPLWYDVDADFVRNAAPLLSDVSAITVTSSDPQNIKKACSELSRVLGPDELRRKMVEFLILRLFEKFPNDPDIMIFAAIYTGNMELFKQLEEIDDKEAVRAALTGTDWQVLVNHIGAILDDETMKNVFFKLYIHLNKKEKTQYHRDS